MKRYGNEYGGWFLEESLIPLKSLVFSVGIGEDVSFDLDLQREKNVKIVAIDPTQKAADFLEKQEELIFDFIPKPLYGVKEKIKMFKNKIPNHVSESILDTHHAADKEYYEVESTTLNELFEIYPLDLISVLKMDVEGSEYSIIENLPSIKIPQVCIEFHHFCTKKTKEDTMKCISKLKEMGYILAHKRGDFKEVTFIHEDA